MGAVLVSVVDIDIAVAVEDGCNVVVAVSGDIVVVDFVAIYYTDMVVLGPVGWVYVVYSLGTDYIAEWDMEE